VRSVKVPGESLASFVSCLMNETHLSPTETRALDLIVAVQATGRPITPGELGEALRMPGSVAVILTRLSQQGYIVHPGMAGSIRAIRDREGRAIVDPASN
jgi:Mn-dependent DtxR family transcriptional regulator